MHACSPAAPRARPPTAAGRATEQHCLGHMGSLQGPSGSTRSSRRGIAGGDREHVPPHAPMQPLWGCTTTVAGGSRATGQHPSENPYSDPAGPWSALHLGAFWALSRMCRGSPFHCSRQQQWSAQTAACRSRPPARPTACTPLHTHARTHAGGRLLTICIWTVSGAAG